MQLSFTADDLTEARRLNARLKWLPRLRMQTTAGRLALNGALWFAELFPLIRHPVRQARIEHRTIQVSQGTARLRVFRCNGPARGIILHFHGGGWTIGNARMSDADNAAMARRLQVTVVSSDYELALSHSLDAVIDECADVISWVSSHAAEEFGSAKVLLRGSSAGAHLVAAALLRLQSAGRDFDAVRGAVLSFGLYDFAGTDMVRKAGPDRLLLHGPTVLSTLRKLTPDRSDAERRSPALSPLFADLGGLPPALFLVGQEDMLLEDNQRMAERWEAANGNAQIIVAPESPHAFDRFDTGIARKVRASADSWMKERLA